jgi:hypothetical protein
VRNVATIYCSLLLQSHFTIIPLVLCVLLSWLTSPVGESTVFGRGWISTIFVGHHPKTVLRMQSPLIYVVVATQLTFCYNWILLLELQQSYCYFLGNGLRRFHRSFSSRFQTCNIIIIVLLYSIFTIIILYKVVQI